MTVSYGWQLAKEGAAAAQRGPQICGPRAVPVVRKFKRLISLNFLTLITNVWSLHRSLPDRSTAVLNLVLQY
jgi:hypothetical protein